MSTTRRIINANNIVYVILLAIGLFATFLTLEFGAYLGFNFGGPLFLVLLSVMFIITFTIVSVPRISYYFSRRLTEWESILILLFISTVVRLWFVFNSSIFPDEFSFLAILQTHPLQNLPYFLTHYQSIAGVELLHPPLASILMSIGYQIYPSIISARLVSTIFSVATILLVYKIARELEFKESAFLLTALFAFLPLNILFTVTALTDVYSTFFGLAAVLAFIHGLKRGGMKWLVLSAIFLGASFWSKYGLPLFWVGLISLLSLFMRFGRPRRQSIPRAILVIGVGFGVFALWGLINPVVFTLSIRSLLSYMGGAVSSVNLGTSNVAAPPPELGTSIVTSITSSASITHTPAATPISANNSSSSPIQAILNFMYFLFPRISVPGGNVSFLDLIAQLPLWLSPLVILLGIVGMFKSFGKNSTRLKILTIWSIVPLLAMAFFIRDVRYTLPAAFAMVALVVIIINRNQKTSRRLVALTFAFIAVFVLINAPIAQQQYYGVTSASAELNTLGLSHSRILTNAPEISLFLPKANIYTIPWNYNLTSLSEVIQSQHINAVVLIYNARANWPVINNSTAAQLISSYDFRISSVPSDFSWYEIAY